MLGASHETLHGVSLACGWLYFSVWSVSFYPQVILNWQRKSVLGLSFDYLSLNCTGFAFYTAFCVWTRVAQVESGVPVTVQINDIAFAGHALLICLVTASQCLLYDCGGQRISRPCLYLLAALWGGLLLHITGTFSGLIHFVDVSNETHYSWTVIQYMGIVKSVISTIKNIPQVYLNYRQRSTAGWAIFNPWMDFTGGWLSLLQLVIDAADADNWALIVSNVPKLLLSFVSIAFDLIYFTQHYFLYPNSNAAFEPLRTSPSTEDHDNE